MSKISIVMPFYNCVDGTSEVIWRKCIESILNQTMDCFTLILIDDCSSDSSSKIVESYKDDRILYIRNKSNIGLTKSLNIGLKYVKSSLIARHDSDDFSDPSRFQIQLDFMNKKDYGVVGSFANVYNLKLEKKDKQTKPISNKNIYLSLRRENAMLHGTVIIRNEIIQKYGGYDESCYVCQDFEMWLRYAKNKVTFQNIPKFLYNRVSHSNCVSKTNRSIVKSTIKMIRMRYGLKK